MPIANSCSIVVFSDVDAVLVSPHAPSFTKAANVLKRLSVHDAALVLCSGKTRAELQFIQQKLDITHPFVFENGGAVFIPDGYFGFDIPNERRVAGHQVVEFGRPYDDVVRQLHRTADRLRIQVVGFSDMSIDDVARECQLPLLQARLAKLREYEEPFRIVDGGANARLRLFKALHAASLRCTKGERFDRIAGPVDSDVCVSFLKSLYQRQLSGAVTTVGLVSAMARDNLLRLVDRSVMVPEEDAERGAINAVDWAEAIVDAVQELRQRKPYDTVRVVTARS